MRDLSINRNIVECKVLSVSVIFSQSDCINRNIVECKVIFLSVSAPALFRINRNIVECKEVFFAMSISSIIVLIETLWNVNDYSGAL